MNDAQRRLTTILAGIAGIVVVAFFGGAVLRAIRGDELDLVDAELAAPEPAPPADPPPGDPSAMGDA